jgi:hypothetical protein
MGRVTVARTPLEMAVSLRSHITHVSDPVLLLQEICLFAAVAAGPAVMVGDPKSTVE